MEWKKMADIAKDLGVSKDVIKYHKKTLEKTQKEAIRVNEKGEILISSTGIDFIKKRLKKERYDSHFETSVRNQLKRLEQGIEFTEFSERESPWF